MTQTKPLVIVRLVGTCLQLQTGGRNFEYLSPVSKKLDTALHQSEHSIAVANFLDMVSK